VQEALLLLFDNTGCQKDFEILDEITSPLFEKNIIDGEVDCFGEHEKKFYRKRNLDNESVIMSKIEKHQVESISKMSQGTLQEVFRECLYPFKSE